MLYLRRAPSDAGIARNILDELSLYQIIKLEKKMRSISEQMSTLCEQLIEHTEEIAIPCDSQTLQLFADQLRNMDRFEYVADAVASLHHVRVPDGFYHVSYTAYRVKAYGQHGEFILDDGRDAGANILATLIPLTLEDVICGGQVRAGIMDATIMGPARWIETIALPVKRLGVLELGLVLESYEQNDGSFEARLRAYSRRSRERTRLLDARRAASTR